MAFTSESTQTQNALFKYVEWAFKTDEPMFMQFEKKEFWVSVNNINSSIYSNLKQNVSCKVCYTQGPHAQIFKIQISDDGTNQMHLLNRNNVQILVSQHTKAYDVIKEQILAVGSAAKNGTMSTKSAYFYGKLDEDVSLLHIYIGGIAPIQKW